MIIGVPKELKNNENRVAMTPSGVAELGKHGHEVLIEKKAGEGSGFADADYKAVGATLTTATALFKKADMIVKVKEPLKEEYGRIRKGQVVFTYFHFAASQQLTKAMMQSGATCIAYETVEAKDGSLPLLTPMSEVAGRMAVQQGAKFLEKPNGGSGTLLGGVPGVRPAYVLILGGGIVGTNAAKIAAGFGANVTIMDINLQRLRELEDVLPKNVQTLYSNTHNVELEVAKADLIIGAVLIPGGKAPILVSKKMLKSMHKGSVIVDVAVDQGGCIETAKVTSHDNPVYEVDGIIHYGVPNIPGAVPRTSTIALTNATLPYVIDIANKGWEQATADNDGLMGGLSVVNGKIVHEAVARAFGK